MIKHVLESFVDGGISTQQIGSAAGVATALSSLTIPANTLKIDGDFIDMIYYGQFAGPAVTFLGGFGGGSCLWFNPGSLDPATGAGWCLEARIVRVSQTSQKCYTNFQSAGIDVIAVVSTGTSDFSQANLLELAVTGTNLNDCLIDGAFVMALRKNI